MLVTEVFEPQLLLLPCVGYGPEGVRLGYGGGFYDRTIASLKPRPKVVGLCYSNGFLPFLRGKPDDGSPLMRAAQIALANAILDGDVARVPFPIHF